MIDTNDKSARTFEITAKNFEEGKARAEAEYGKDGEVSCYLLEKEKKGFLGIGAAPCRIRVTVTPKVDVIGEVLRAGSNSAASRPEKSNTQRTPKEQQKKPQSNVNESQKPQRNPAPANTAASSAPDVQKDSADKPKKDKDATKVPGKSGSNQKKSPKNGANPQKETVKAPKKDDAVAAPQDQKTESRQPRSKREPRRERENMVISQSDMDIALEFINTLLKNMESSATAVQAEAPEGAVFEGVYPRIEITGDKSGILIGHHGETMDAIQFLANLCLNRKTGAGGREFVKIVVDIENYREKREETLRALARRMAARAIKYKRNVVLEPMNPYERHIIHAELQDMENIDTHSVGSDENRKVVITYEGEDKQERKGRSGNRGPRDRAARGDRSNRAEHSESAEQKRPSQPAQRPKVVTLIDVSDEESAAIKEAYEAYQEEKAGKERPKRASSIDEILGSDNGLF